MQKIEIEGGKELTGKIKISGAKNSAVALIPASILCNEVTSIHNVPNITDRNALIEIIEALNGSIKITEDKMEINTEDLKNTKIEEELSSKLRASYYFMGALLGRFGHAEIHFPGGCNIGKRKIDFHLKGFEALGATIKEENDLYIIHAEELKGSTIDLEFASVGATINIILAAVKAKGKTTINNAAKEPEIINVVTYLNDMGAKISGAGTNKIEIEGVDYLHSTTIEVIPDRIEAGTYIIIGALLGKDLVIENIITKHLISLITKLQEIGVELKIEENKITINKKEEITPLNITTLIYPGFPTDLAQPMSVLMTQCNGLSILEETIYSNRMGQVPYLNLMGANIEIKNQTAYIKGKTPLYGNDVEASDLRAGAALIIAGLIAEGKTKIEKIEHILRGYENIIEKLTNVGAKIKIIEE